MSIDASGTLYWTGHGGVVLVNDPVEVIEDVARAYDIRWLVLNRADTVASMAPILDGAPRPAWLGAAGGEPAGAPAPGRRAAAGRARWASPSTRSACDAGDARCAGAAR